MKTSQEKYLNMFKSITDEMYETTKRKNSDYTGDASDAFKNFTMVEDLTEGVITTEQGFYTRMSDKWMRFTGFMKNGVLKVKDEKIEDTLLDLAVYCILLVCYRRAKKDAEALSAEGGTGGTGIPWNQFNGNGSTTTLPPNFGEMSSD